MAYLELAFILYGHQDGKNFWVNTLSIKLESLNNYIVKISFFFYGSTKLTFTSVIIARLIVPAVGQLVRDVRRVKCMIVLLYNWLGTRVARMVVWVGVFLKKVQSPKYSLITNVYFTISKCLLNAYLHEYKRH